MMVMTMPANKAGRDFVVGDMHGCLDDLLAVLTGRGWQSGVTHCLPAGWRQHFPAVCGAETVTA